MLKKFLLTLEEARQLRKCWGCGESTAHRNASCFFCSNACKQLEYRRGLQAKHDFLIGPENDPFVTHSPAIGEESVTPLFDRWGSPDGSQI